MNKQYGMSNSSNIGSAEVKKLLQSFNYFQDKKHRPEIEGAINEDLYSFEYYYRGIELSITKTFRKKFYIIELRLNHKLLINCRRSYTGRKFERLFL